MHKVAFSFLFSFHLTNLSYIRTDRGFQGLQTSASHFSNTVRKTFEWPEMSLGVNFGKLKNDHEQYGRRGQESILM